MSSMAVVCARVSQNEDTRARAVIWSRLGCVAGTCAGLRRISFAKTLAVLQRCRGVGIGPNTSRNTSTVAPMYPMGSIGCQSAGGDSCSLMQQRPFLMHAGTGGHSYAVIQHRRVHIPNMERCTGQVCHHVARVQHDLVSIRGPQDTGKHA